MATPIVKNLTQIGIKAEVTEGTFVPVAADTDFVQPLEDGFELISLKEQIDRNILTSSIGRATPRAAQESSTASLPVEMRASGIEGGEPDFDLLLKGAVGDVRTVGSQFVTDTGHSSTVLQVTAHPFAVGDSFVILEAGQRHICAVRLQTATTLTICPEAPFTPSDNVVLSKTRVYFPADTGHPSLSLSYFWANEILQKGIGMKVNNLNFGNVTTGQTGVFEFGLEGLNFDEVDGSSGFSPVFDSGLPPIHLQPRAVGAF